MDLKNKIAVVTGGSSGIGKAISIALSNEGCKVIFTYNSNEKGADKTLEELGGNAFKFKVDTTKEKDIKDLSDFVKEKHESVDIIVNNAGFSHSNDYFDLDAWSRSFDTNIFGYVRFIKHFVNLMPSGSKVLNISSVYAEDKVAWQGKSADASSKAAINNMTRTLAKKLAPNILVNAIAPGYVDTKLWDEFTNNEKEEAKNDLLIERLIKPEEIAEMAVAVIKNDAMTGEIVVVDGGLSLKTV